MEKNGDTLALPEQERIVAILNKIESLTSFFTPEKTVKAKSNCAQNEHQQGVHQQKPVVEPEEGREVQRTLRLYSLDAILAVGYSGRSKSACQY